ncbi:hypothetical protein VDIAB_30272 [Vibrio diabolicus]|nr:hypothetical protein VDIAB_30272 [Vibrio diabolicus]
MTQPHWLKCLRRIRHREMLRKGTERLDAWKNKKSLAIETKLFKCE